MRGFKEHNRCCGLALPVYEPGIDGGAQAMEWVFHEVNSVGLIALLG